VACSSWVGEPGDNLEAVSEATACLLDARRFGFAREKVVISTVAPHLCVFGAILETNSTLAWSVHALDAGLRRRLVPTAQNDPVELRDALCAALERRKKTSLANKPSERGKVPLEYVPLVGVNDSLQHADRLADFVAPIEAACAPRLTGVSLNEATTPPPPNRTGVLVSLIPFNPHEATRRDALQLTRPSPCGIQAFQRRLRERGRWASVRKTRGDDACAACGQLAGTAHPATDRPTSKAARFAQQARGGDAYFSMRRIAVVEADPRERARAPRQPTARDGVQERTGSIRLDPAVVPATALDDGLAGFEHCWVVAAAHLNTGWSATASPPRGGQRRGFFATRSPHRPNPILQSALSIVGVDGHTLRVADLDLLDGTPVLDIKPDVPEADAFLDAKAG